jgi:hypothetical protein
MRRVGITGLLVFLLISAGSHAIDVKIGIKRLDYENVKDMDDEKDEERLPDWVRSAYLFFTGKGMTSVQASGVVANLMMESGGNPDVYNQSGSRAYGLQQWLGPRKKKLNELYGEHPTFDQQLDYLYNEYSGQYAGLGWNFREHGKYVPKSGYYQYGKREFDESNHPAEAAVKWNQGYGRPGKQELHNDRRIAWANRIYDRLGGEAAPERDRSMEFLYMPRFEWMSVDGQANTDYLTELSGLTNDASLITSHAGTSPVQPVMVTEQAAEPAGFNPVPDEELAAFRSEIQQQNVERNFLMNLINQMNKPVTRQPRRE